MQRSDCRLPSGAGSLDPHRNPPDTHGHGLAAALLRRQCRGKGRGLLGALEPGLPGTRPGHRVPRHIGDGDEGVVEGRLDMGDPLGLNDLLGLFRPYRLGLCHASPSFRNGKRGREWRALGLQPRPRPCLALLLGGLLLPGDGPSGSLVSPGIGVGPLTPHRQSPPVP